MDFSDRQRRRWLVALVLSGLGLAPALIDLASGTLVRIPWDRWIDSLDFETAPSRSLASLWTWIALTGLAPVFAIAMKRLVSGGPFEARPGSPRWLDVRSWAICAAVGLLLLPIAAVALYIAEAIAINWKTSGLQFRDSLAMYPVYLWAVTPAVVGAGVAQWLVYGKVPARRHHDPTLPPDVFDPPA